MCSILVKPSEESSVDGLDDVLVRVEGTLSTVNGHLVLSVPRRDDMVVCDALETTRKLLQTGVIHLRLACPVWV
jgi:hypothetical protein